MDVRPPGSPEYEDDVSLSPASSHNVKDEGEPVKREFADAEGDDDEEDRYEDVLDLDTTNSDAKVWMVRMPKFLLERLSAPNLEGQELGKVRIWAPKGNRPWKVRMLLNDSPSIADIPHNYNLRLVNEVVENTYVLQEKELPHKRRSVDGDGLGAGSSGSVKQGSSSSGSSAGSSNGSGIESGRKTDGQDPDSTAGAGVGSIKPPAQASYGPTLEAVQAAQAAAYDKYTPFLRQAPKKTALVGQAVHEVVATPDFNDPNYSRLLQQRREMELPSPSRQVTMLNNTAGVGGAKYGATLRSQRSSWAQAQQKKRELYRNTDAKALRIPKAELLDKLFQLFEEYEFWTLKALKERTRQPEVYLREILDSIAVLNKKGPYAMKYGLRSEFRQAKDSGASLESLVNSMGGDDGENRKYDTADVSMGGDDGENDGDNLEDLDDDKDDDEDGDGADADAFETIF